MWWLGWAACGAAPDLAREAGRLPACPPRPNCVSTEAGTVADQAVEPLPLALGRSVPETLDALEALVASLPRTKVVRRDEDGLWVTFRTPTLRFVDDVLFRVAPEEGVIHVRSASRLGSHDLGVNAARVEELRRRWLATPQ